MKNEKKKKREFTLVFYNFNSLVGIPTRGLGSRSWVKIYLMNTVMCAGLDFNSSMSWKRPSVLGRGEGNRERVRMKGTRV